MTSDAADITAIVLTKNEELRLASALESLAFCRRTVVVDSGSTDRTATIAKERGADFYTHVQPPPFRIDAQRNWALDSCDIRTAWVLFLDADEVVPPALEATLRKIVASGDAVHAAYELTPRYLFWGTWLKRTLGYPNWHARFLRFGSARFAGGVWEHFETQGLVGRIDEPYDHYANCKGMDDWIARHVRYAAWDADMQCALMVSGQAGDFGTTRKARLRTWAARWWRWRPLARFLYMYFFRLGFLDGWAALHFCRRYFIYDTMFVQMVIEKRRTQEGLPL
jgi:glycosyltransferase involved in cell wall biosynthesis